MFSNLILFDQQSKTNNTQFTVNSNREAAAVTCWTLTSEEHHQSSLSSARSVTITQERLNIQSNSSHDPSERLQRLFPWIWLFKKRVCRSGRCSWRTPRLLQMTLPTYLSCMFVCSCLHPSSSWVSSGPLFAGRDGLICCQRCGGQMMWEARPWSSPTDTWEKNTQNTSQGQRDGNIPDSLTNVVILRVAASWRET